MKKSKHLLIVFSIVFLAAAMSLPVTAADFDLGGRTVTISDFGPLLGYLEDPRLEDHLQDVEELFNCEFNTTILNAHGGMESEAVERMITDVLEGESTVDLYVVGVQAIPGLVREGLIHPLDDALEEIQYFDNLPSLYQDWDIIRHLGQTWGIDRSEVARNVEGIIWNKDLFEREGLPNLYELHQNYEWTWEAFEDIALKATRDTTGDGELDQWGVTTHDHYASSPNFLVSWSYSNNAMPTQTVDGREQFAFNSSYALESMDFWQGLIEQEAVRLSELWRFPQGDAAMMRYLLWMSEAADWHGITAMEDDWGVVPYPMGPEADDYVAPMTHSWVLVAPITNENPAETLAVFSAAMKRSAMYCEPLGIDVDEWHDDLWYEIYGVNYRDRETAEITEWMVENVDFIPYVDLLMEAGFIEALAEVWEGEDPSTVMSAIEPEVQALIDDMFDQ